MLERLNKAVDPQPSSVALTAFQTAIRQQEDFKETAEDIRVRQEREKAEQQQQAREEARQAKESSNHAVDVLVPDPNESDASSQTEQRGSAVDVEA